MLALFGKKLRADRAGTRLPADVMHELEHATLIHRAPTEDGPRVVVRLPTGPSFMLGPDDDSNAAAIRRIWRDLDDAQTLRAVRYLAHAVARSGAPTLPNRRRRPEGWSAWRPFNWSDDR